MPSTSSVDEVNNRNAAIKREQRQTGLTMPSTSSVDEVNNRNNRNNRNIVIKDTMTTKLTSLKGLVFFYSGYCILV